VLDNPVELWLAESARLREAGWLSWPRVAQVNDSNIPSVQLILSRP
jgi:hypothetical protein